MTDFNSKIAHHLIERELDKLNSRDPKIIIDGSSKPGLVAHPQTYATSISGVSQTQPYATTIPGVQQTQPYVYYTPAPASASWNELLERETQRWPLSDEDQEPSYSAIFRFQPHVGIIGAGVAGLRIAMMLQRLNIPYTIYEASERVGGRVYTYHFKPGANPSAHDYYDVGAMRFPEVPGQESTFALFKELNLESKKIEYIMSIPENFRNYNGIQTSAQVASTKGDHFEEGRHNHGIVPSEYLNKKYTRINGTEVYGVSACTSAALDPYRFALVNNVRMGWELLMQHDWASTRSFLRQVAGYPWGVVQWMESRNSGTGGYSTGLTDAILFSLNFEHTQPFKWWCLDGGTEVLTKAMHETLVIKPLLNHRVTAVSVLPHPSGRVGEWSMKLDVNQSSDLVFDHVVSATSFAGLRTIDTTHCHMSYHQREAIRSINYGPAVKVAIKFKTRWWEQLEPPQRGGASMTDRQSRVVVYPSYGLNDNPNEPGVLMVSYNWHQDATRFGAMISSSDWSKQHEPSTTGRTRSETVLLEQIYEDLAVLHGKTVQWYKDETLDYHAFDWYHNEFSMGGSAHYMSGQYENFFPAITTTAGFGRFHFAGEVASTHNGWIAGALDSAWRVVYEILVKDCPWKIPLFEEIYGKSVIFGDNEAEASAQAFKGTYLKELEEALGL